MTYLKSSEKRKEVFKSLYNIHSDTLTSKGIIFNSTREVLKRTHGFFISDSKFTAWMDYYGLNGDVEGLLWSLWHDVHRFQHAN